MDTTSSNILIGLFGVVLVAVLSCLPTWPPGANVRPNGACLWSTCFSAGRSWAGSSRSPGPPPAKRNRNKRRSPLRARNSQLAVKPRAAWGRPFLLEKEMADSIAGIPGLDPTLPDISLVVGGRKYQLCYDVNALALIEADLGKNIFTERASLLEPKTIRTALWGALLRQNPELTQGQAGALIMPQNWKEVMAKIQEALFWGFSAAEGGGAAPADPSSA